MAKACIFGVQGSAISAAERAFFTDCQPLGFILFARNCSEPQQLQALIDDLNGLCRHDDVPILIDQEGGRVARLTPPHWRAAPPAAAFGAVYARDADTGRKATRLNAQLIGAELSALGITVDCAPVLDVPQPGADPIIGDRALAASPHAVADLADAFCAGLAAAGVLPVIKHIPGHGRAGADSHLALPRVDAPARALRTSDFATFKALSGGPAPQPWAMTAHVVYEAFDAEHPATLSRRLVEEVIRGEIGFDGVLVTDDLSMNALTGPFGERAAQAMAAGCDIVLHCNGSMAEMTEIAAATGEIGPETAARLARSHGARQTPDAFDAAEAELELAAILRDHDVAVG